MPSNLSSYCKVNTLPILTALFVFCCTSVVRCETPNPREAAKALLDKAGINGGLVVQLGAPHATITTAFGEFPQVRVQSLSTDAS